MNSPTCTARFELSFVAASGSDALDLKQTRDARVGMHVWNGTPCALASGLLDDARCVVDALRVA